MMKTCERCEAAVEESSGGFCLDCGVVPNLAFIADEARPFRDFMVSELSELGYRVEVFTSDEGLLDRIRRERPALVLANVYLRGVLGVELCEAIRAIPDLGTRVLLIGAIFRADRFRSRPESLYGADGYLEEGLSAESFAAIVRRAAGRALPEAADGKDPGGR